MGRVGLIVLASTGENHFSGGLPILTAQSTAAMPAAEGIIGIQVIIGLPNTPWASRVTAPWLA